MKTFFLRLWLRIRRFFGPHAVRRSDLTVKLPKPVRIARDTMPTRTAMNRAYMETRGCALTLRIPYIGR